MSIDPPRYDASAGAQDLWDLDVTLCRLLPLLLLGRFDADILHRWAKTRGWVSSAQEGDWVVDLPVMSMAVYYLTCIVDDQAGPHQWPDIWRTSC
jgi:hypothetical protein